MTLAILLLACSSFGLGEGLTPKLAADDDAAAAADTASNDATDVSDTARERTDDSGSTDVVGQDTAAEMETPPDDPSARGPYAVGVKTVELWDDSRWRSIPVEVWYPIDPAAPDGSANTYEIEILGLKVYEMATDAHRDATPLAGAWPAVMFSHGYGGIRFQSYFLTEHLASHGFVVVAPDHMGNTLMEPWNLGSDEAALQSSIDRPLDLSFALDALLDGELGVQADPARVGITGHSFGGWASIQTPLVDDRFIATFPMAPGFKETAHPTDSAGLGIPFLVIGGSVDATCEFDENQLATYDAAKDPRYLVRVEGAGHLDFSNLCEVEMAKMFIDDGCNPDSIDPLTVQARAKTLGTTFAKVYIAGDTRYSSLLDESAVTALGNVTYWRDP